MKKTTWNIRVGIPVLTDELPEEFRNHEEVILDVHCMGYDDPGSSLNCPTDSAYPPESEDWRQINAVWADGVRLDLPGSALVALEKKLEKVIREYDISEEIMESNHGVSD